jgi:hypothetical protein
VRQTDPEGLQRSKLFHQWRAQTTNLLSAMGPRNGREETIVDIADALDDLLQPLRSWGASESFRQALKGIAHDAVALDESFSGQQTYYCLRYPDRRSNVAFDPIRMRMVEESSGYRKVAFTIRPGLCKAGGQSGEKYGTLVILDHYLVATCATGSRYS